MKSNIFFVHLSIWLAIKKKKKYMKNIEYKILYMKAYEGNETFCKNSFGKLYSCRAVHVRCKQKVRPCREKHLCYLRMPRGNVLTELVAFTSESKDVSLLRNFPFFVNTSKNVSVVDWLPSLAGGAWPCDISK